MWNYFGQKSTKVLLAFFLLAGVGGFIIATNANHDGGDTNTNTNTSESSDEEISDATIKNDGARVENTYVDPQGVSETTEATTGSGDYNWYALSDTGITSNTTSGVNATSASNETRTPVVNESKSAVATTTETKAVASVAKSNTVVADAVKAVQRVENVVAEDVAKNENVPSVETLEETKNEVPAIAKDETPGVVENETPAAIKDEIPETVKDETPVEQIPESIPGDETTPASNTTVSEENNKEIENPNPNAEQNVLSEAEEEIIRAEEEQAKQNSQIQEEEQISHPELYAGWENVFAYNTYPWQNDCPEKQDQYLTTINGIKVGGYVCECVSYVGWKAFEYYGLYLGWGNAYSWDDRARANGYVVNHTPAVNTIGQMDGGAYGHVFWVERVNNDGSIDVTEYNNAYATQIRTGYFYYGDFGTRTIPAREVGQYNYIHLH